MFQQEFDWPRAFFQTCTLALLLGLGYVTVQLVSYMADVVTILVSALLLAYVLQVLVDPLANFLPRLLAVVLVGSGGLVAVTAAGALLGPMVLVQVRDLVASLPEALSRTQIAASQLQLWLATRQIKVDVPLEAWLLPRLQEISSYLTGNMGGFVASGFFSFFSAAMTVVCAFYFLKDGDYLWNRAGTLLPPQARLTFDYFRIELDKSLNNYFRGQIINASVVLIASTIAFSLLKMNYGVVGGLVWGVCEIIPIFGSYVGIGTALILAILQGGDIVWKVLIAALVIQQLKDNVISPRVMSHTTGLHPVVIIAAVLLGAKIAGFLGILLAIPITAVAVATLRVYLSQGTWGPLRVSRNVATDTHASAGSPENPVESALVETSPRQGTLRVGGG